MLLLVELLSLTVLLCSSAVPAWPPAGTTPPVLLFGPLAHHPAPGLPGSKHVANETLELLAGRSGKWDEVRGRIVASGGALHTSIYAWGASSQEPQPEAQRELARLMRAQGLSLSVEAGSGFCGRGSGTRNAASNLGRLSTYLASGGKVKFWQLASSFSLTHVHCPNQTLQVTVHEAAAYAAAVQSALPAASLFLYDALPHYSVGTKWPQNPGGPRAHFGLELGSVLHQLKQAMAAHGVVLHGYWADCPFDSSDGYPYGDGYKKVAAAAELVTAMGLQFGKTFNAIQAGQTSSEAYYHATLDDFARTAAVIPSSSGNATLSYVMSASWYLYPTYAAPESTPYTEANVARDIFRQITHTR